MCAQALEKSKIENTKINKAKARGGTLSVSAFGAGLKDVLTQKNSRCGQAIICLAEPCQEPVCLDCCLSHRP